MIEKQLLRTQILRQRKQITEGQRTAYNAAIVQRCLPFFKGTCALYEAFGSEVDVGALKEEASCYGLPKTKNDGSMCFLCCNAHSILQKSSLGILEPVDGELIDPARLDVIIVPLVAFDEDCYRLGYGKGYYDRFLQQTKALRIGVAYECQKIKQVPTEPHDLFLDMIITEKRIYRHKDESIAVGDPSFSV